MNSRNTIQDELTELNSGLSSDLNGTSYVVPQGYFEGLADVVLARIKTQNASVSDEIAELSPLLAGLSKKMPYSVPEDYFQISMEELPLMASENEESAMLSFIGKEMPYELPAGYFDNLSDEILSRLSVKKAKVVPFGRKLVRMMAAAAVVGVIIISGIFYFRNSGNNVSTADPVAVELKKVSTEELNAFIKNTDANVLDDKTQVTAKNTPPKESQKLFKDVSDEELKAFLDQVPVDDEELMD